MDYSRGLVAQDDPSNFTTGFFLYQKQLRQWNNEYNRNSSLPDFQNPKIETLKFLVNFHLILVQFMIVLEIGKTLDNSVEVLSKW